MDRSCQTETAREKLSSDPSSLSLIVVVVIVERLEKRNKSQSGGDEGGGRLESMASNLSLKCRPRQNSKGEKKIGKEEKEDDFVG